MDSLFSRARRVIPGGVHSPVRALHGVGEEPFFTAHAAGPLLIDSQGRQLIDFCMSFGPLILGHADPDVRAAVHEAVDHGSSFGTAETRSLELAELVTERLPWIEQIRFVNSGTEAVMTALRLARAVTGRDKILKFDGCYHGHVDALLMQAGSGLAMQTEATSAGVPRGVAADTLVLPLDDEQSLAELFAEHGRSLAAAIIEPLPANYGLLPQRPQFLRRLRQLCRENDALLIFDEVITGFRLGFGGMAEVLDTNPDVVTYGKIIGGGFPVGAVAGRRELMELLAPVGPVYQAGTLSANPVAMSAGLATLTKLLDGEIYRRLAQLGDLLEERLTSQ
nr:glutamate-1-semialdehyde 2,1-aminomutase [Gammaproteobacteria bacterium]